MCRIFVWFFTVLSVVSLVSPVSAQTNTVVIPMFDDGPTEKTIFVTDSTYTGNLGGISGADDKCQSAADNAVPPLPGIYKAWISRSGVPSVPTRPSFQKHDLPYKNVDGSLVATSFNDFLDNVFSGIIKSITGSSITIRAWTGTNDDGSVDNLNCSDWSSNNMDDFGIFGVNTGGTGIADWSGDGSTRCSLLRSLYCFEQ